MNKTKFRETVKKFVDFLEGVIPKGQEPPQVKEEKLQERDSKGADLELTGGHAKNKRPKIIIVVRGSRLAKKKEK